MPKKVRAIGDCTPATALSKQTHVNDTAEAVALTIKAHELRVDSRLIAKQLRNQPKAVMVLIERYADDFRQFGLLTFEMEAVKASGARGTKHQRYALLNEDQAFFLLSLSRNTDHVVKLKAKLIAAFGEARRAEQQRNAEYLPVYRALHDVIAEKAAGSTHKGHVHLNVNRLVNKTCGLEAGQRPTLPLAQQSMLILAQAVATRAMSTAVDHREGYQRAKVALQALHAVAALGVDA